MQLWLKYGVDGCLHAHRTHTQQEQQSGQQLMASPTAVWLAMAPSSSTVPGSPADQATKLRGPWLQTQLAIAALVGVTSFLSFCFFRTRSKVLYMPRTLLKGFSPHEVHSKASFFGWILPTLRTSEFTVLQIVGLDAVVLLSFFKTSFYFFGICTLLAAVALVPINYRENGTSEGVPPPAPDPDDESLLLFTVLFKRDTYHGSTLYLTSHLIFTYLFSILALFMLYRAYRAFIHTRQLFSLDHALSIPARTVLITSLPHHLRSERVLAQYWEDMGLKVESVSVGRNVGSLQNLLEDRTTKLLALETAWMKYVGNPVSKEALQSGYDRDALTREIIFDEDGRPEGAARGYNVRMSEDDLLAGTSDIVSPTTPAPEDTTEQSDLEAPPVGINDHFEIANKKRPTHRPRLITNEKVDLLDHLARQYRTADEAVKRRRKGRFRPANIAFVTFEDIGSAQIAAQVVHYPQPDSVNTTLAPDPRDIYWGNMLLSNASLQARNILVLGAMLLLLSFWLVPVSALARLLNYDAIKKYLPWLTKILDKSPRLRVFVQNTLPTTAVISFNALLPFLLEWLCILQGLRSRSEIEYSLLKKYHIFLIINVVLVFIAVSTWDLAKQFANEPMKLVNKLALSLPGARNFFLSYVILQGIGIMPLQLVQLSVILPRWLYRLIWTRTPRDFAELNTPPAISLGTIYPQALLIFLICLTYSVITPLILLFGTIYFGMGYLVYKYKLLFIYFRPYESRGQAWPISFVRMCWGLLIFQLFMTGLFALREAALLTLLMFPLLIFTLYTSWSLHTRFHALSKYVNLAQAAEVKRTQDNGTTYEAGALASDVERLRKGHPVTMSQSNLNRGRYRSKDERDDGLYVVKQDSKTDYIQPPMSQSFYGVLSNDRKRYNHPAISGRLPVPWLPAGKKDYLESVHSILPSSSDIENIQPDLDIDLSSSGAVLIDLKRRFTDFRNMTKRMAVKTAGGQLPPPSDGRSTGRHGRPASRRDRSGSDCADPSFHNDAAMQNTASIWGAPTNLLSKSPASTSGRSQDDAGDSSEDEEDEEAGQRDRYTYYPHKRSSSTGSNASHLPEDEESGGNETDH